MRFETPWAFLLLLIVPVVLWLHRRHRGRSALRFSSTDHAAGTPCSLRQRLLFLPAALRVLVLVLLVTAIARPQEGTEQVRDVTEGVAIEMVVDRSGSMGAELEYGREHPRRLDVVKRIFKEFIYGNDDDLPGRPSDLVGMVTFARYADTVCPLTLAHGALDRFLETVDLVQRRSEDGTAIGDALALAAARLQTAEETLARQTGASDGEYEIKSKVIILLTDGENNCGKRTPEEAAALAKEWEITIYTIGVGGGEGATTIRTPFGEYKVPLGRQVDERSLKAIAEKTGGRCWVAEDAESLRKIYAEIDALEKTRIETALSCTFFRRIP